MSGARVAGIQMIDSGAATPLADAAVFVGGPIDGTRRTIDNPPWTIAVGRGIYRRSVHCADDGAVRYVFEAEPDAPDSLAGL